MIEEPVNAPLSAGSCGIRRYWRRAVQEGSATLCSHVGVEQSRMFQYMRANNRTFLRTKLDGAWVKGSAGVGGVEQGTAGPGL